MRRSRLDDLEAEREEPPEELSFADIVEIAARKIVTAIVIAGGLVALAIYFRPSPPRYQAAVGDGRIVRIDTRSGSVIACEGTRCYRILRRGQDLDDRAAAAQGLAGAGRAAGPARARTAVERGGPGALSHKARPAMAALALLCAGCGQQKAAADKAPAAAKAAPEAPRNARLYLASNGLELVDGAGAARPGRVRDAGGGTRGAGSSPSPAPRRRAPTIPIAASSPGSGSTIAAASRSSSRRAGSSPGSRARAPATRCGAGSRSNSPRAALGALGPVALRRVNVTDVPIEEFTAGGVSGVLLGGKVQDFTAGRSACR